MSPLLQIKGLTVEFRAGKSSITAVGGADLDVGKDEIAVLAGESGSGKTVTALSVLLLLPANARVTKGDIAFNGRSLRGLDEASLRQVRGKEIACIFQEPVSYLNPVYSVGNQIAEAIQLHQRLSSAKARGEALRLLSSVKIQEAHRVFSSYPHQLSGGMNQRAFIAMSLACRPKLLIADEPTTSLDVTTEASILELLIDLKKEIGFSLLFITHNLSIAKRIADRIHIMYQGRVVEQGNTEEIFMRPSHSHTKELVAAYEKIGRL